MRELHELARDRASARSSWSCRDGPNRRSTPSRLNSSRCTSIQCARRRGTRARNSIAPGVLVLALGAVLLLDLPFDRQAVAVPAGHVVGVVPASAASGRHVLQDLVERVADMNVAIRIGRPVMQTNFAPPGGARAQALVEAIAAQRLRISGSRCGSPRASGTRSRQEQRLWNSRGRPRSLGSGLAGRSSSGHSRLKLSGYVGKDRRKRARGRNTAVPGPVSAGPGC
jgi:hypothetical protein